MYVCMYVCVYVCMYVCMYIMYMYIHVYIHTCMHICIHTHFIGRHSHSFAESTQESPCGQAIGEGMPPALEVLSMGCSARVQMLESLGLRVSSRV